MRQRREGGRDSRTRLCNVWVGHEKSKELKIMMFCFFFCYYQIPNSSCINGKEDMKRKRRSRERLDG
jgi:hypothetical protein